MWSSHRVMGLHAVNFFNRKNINKQSSVLVCLRLWGGVGKKGCSNYSERNWGGRVKVCVCDLIIASILYSLLYFTCLHLQMQENGVTTERKEVTQISKKNPSVCFPHDKTMVVPQKSKKKNEVRKKYSIWGVVRSTRLW